MSRLPDRADYVIIGAGIHGLSTSMHLAQKLKASGKTVGAGGVRIVVLDKTGIGAGASGIACGVVRNNYYQPAMRELMAHSVSVWESDPKAYSYHPVGYMVLFESDNLVALASEEVAIRTLLPREIDTSDPYDEEVRVWQR